jgi:hypothetical protein
VEFPSLHHRKEGVDARSNKKSRSYLVPRRRVAFLFVLNRKTTPASIQHSFTPASAGAYSRCVAYAFEVTVVVMGEAWGGIAEAPSS